MLHLAHMIFRDGFIKTIDTPVKVKTTDILNSE